MTTSGFPPAWHQALEHRRRHFSFAPRETLRLLHDEDPRVRCDRLGKVSWFYWYGPARPNADDLTAMAAFASAAGSPHWKVRLMHNQGHKTQDQIEWGTEEPEEWIAAEGDLNYILRSNQGRSPGLFLDQRPNRQWIRQQARAKSVLNLFSYTGGFSLNSTLGAAEEVVSVDSSRSALAWSEANFRLNTLDPLQSEFWKVDARYFLRGCKNRGRNFDLVICDPPSFSQSRAGAFKIERDLSEILTAIDQILSPEGRIFIATNFEKWKSNDFAHYLRRALPGYAPLELPPPDPDFVSTKEPLMKALALAKKS